MNKKNLVGELRSFVLQYQHHHQTKTEWRDPLVGFASADDPLFTELKKAVSSTHLLPVDLLPSARSVVVFFIPFSKRVADSNRSGRSASRDWALAYLETNTLIEETGVYMKQYIESKGFKISTTPSTRNFDPGKLISDWSHRHAAFIAGLGTFGLNNMLITESGCCGRFGSFVASLEIPADPRAEGEHCLYKSRGDCMRCVERCVGSALSADQFDRHNCYRLCLENEEEHRRLGKADVCGKCLVGVPCSFTNPRKKEGP
jgi:epoxyqueuosine reductase QueG